MDGKDGIHLVCRCTAWIVVYRDAMYDSTNAIPLVKYMVLFEKSRCISSLMVESH